MSKYHAVRTEVSGISFASKKEASRYSELVLLERAGEISDLKLQVPFKLEISGVLICKYIADWVYTEHGHQVVEDTKGIKRGSAYTIFKMKKRLMLALYNIDVKES